MLSLLVVGTDRDPEGEDINGADATIINNTDMKLYVKIVMMTKIQDLRLEKNQVK